MLHLLGTSPGQPDVAFLPESDHSFFDKPSGMRIVFDPEKGRDAGFTLHSRGQEIKAELVTEESDAGQPAPVEAK